MIHGMDTTRSGFSMTVKENMRRQSNSLSAPPKLTPDNAQVYSNLAAVYIDMSDPKVIPQAEAALTNPSS